MKEFLDNFNLNGHVLGIYVNTDWNENFIEYRK